MTDEKPTTHVDINVPGTSTEDAMLRVYIAGLGSGYLSAIVQTGASPDVAKHLVSHILHSILSDPIPRNLAVDSAMAAFRGDSDWNKAAPGVVPLHLHPGECGEADS